MWEDQAEAEYGSISMGSDRCRHPSEEVKGNVAFGMSALELTRLSNLRTIGLIDLSHRLAAETQRRRRPWRVGWM